MTTGPHDLQTFMLTCEATLTFQYSGTEKYSIFFLLISGFFFTLSQKTLHFYIKLFTLI